MPRPKLLAMTRDEGLEELIREHLGSDHAWTEKPLFGGWVWLLHGHLVCGSRSDGLLIRLGKGRDGWALRLQGVEPMISRGKQIKGWVRVRPKAFDDDALCRKLLTQAVELVDDMANP